MDEAKLREKHKGLLQEHLVLQKECVLKKRKLKETKERKATLLDEIRFLKRRRDFLVNKKLEKSEQQREIIQSHKTDTKHNAESSRRYSIGSASTSRPASQNQRPPIIPIKNLVTGGKEGIAFAPSNSGKQGKILLADSKRADKRKISWQDQLSLKA